VFIVVYFVIDSVRKLPSRPVPPAFLSPMHQQIPACDTLMARPNRNLRLHTFMWLKRQLIPFPSPFMYMQVILAKYRHNEYCALKVMKKEDLVENDWMELLSTETEILHSIKGAHPFILNLIGVIQTQVGIRP
jgi:hypothetical protein